MHTPRPAAPLLCTLLLALTGCGPQDADEPPPHETDQVQSPLTQVTGFGTNPGNLLMYRHVPTGMPASAALVVVMHGCTQTAAAMEASGWTAAANLYKFFVVYPQQQSGNNSSSCFNWFEPGDTARGQGEALSIKQMVDHMKATYSVDPARVFVVGFSGGGYMAPVMLATYPDVFSAGAIDAGGPYGCATTMSQAFTCMSPGVTKTAGAWGELVRGAFPGYTGVRPRVSIWHGTSDYTVNKANLTESMKQWTDVHGTDQTADTTETVAGHAHKVYRGAGGQALVETYELANMGHAVAVDPQFSFPGSSSVCGSTGSYFADANLCATYSQAQFFGLTGAGSPPGDPTAPVTATFGSLAAEDGYVKANADGSLPAVGTLASLAVGRGTDAKHNRSLLSFDTASLPDTALITRAYLTVTYSSSSSDPWANPAGNTLVVDVKAGTFGGAATESADWSAAATASAVASIAKLTSGTRSSSDFGGSGLSAINRSGRTQLRLRFSENPTATAYVFLKEGASATLTVVYAP
jgi:poly(hydroxyalkanoate) depolymerase family esterase